MGESNLMIGNRSNELSLKLVSAVLTVSLTLGTAAALSGCQKYYRTLPTQHTHVTTDVLTKPGSPTEASPTPTPSPTPDPKKEAMKLAEYVGLAEEDLRGKYELFERYSVAVSDNPNLEGYKAYVFHLFPVVADYLKPENEKFFFERVKTLKIVENHTDGVDGQYIREDNKIEIEPDLKELMGEDLFSSVLYHEMMHFIDININGDVIDDVVAYMSDGTLRKYGDLDYAERGWVKEYIRTYFTEGGCEMFTAEYFTVSPNAYLMRVRFMVALKYIFGSDRINKMFFESDSDWQFVQLLVDAGFTTEEIVKFSHTMQETDIGIKDPKNSIDPREALIRLYIKNIGPDYEKDSAFCFMLGSMNDDHFSKIDSEYKKFYSKLKGIDQMEVYQIWGFITSETGDYETKWGFAGMPGPFYVNGELKVVATSAPLEGDIKDYKTVIVDYNYETKELSNFKLFDKWAPDLFDEKSIPVPDMVEPSETSTTDTSGTDGTTETT
jgi:hypothetical protein